MRWYPSDEDRDDLKRLDPEPWMVEQLRINPSYPHWGPHEDYMSKTGDRWDSRVIVATWAAFGPWDLNDWNEIANFYFSIKRATRQCKVCGGSGAHPDAQWVSRSFYGHSTPFRGRTVCEERAVAIMDGFGGERRSEVISGYPSAETLAKYPPAFTDFCEAMRNGDGYWNDKITEDEAAALVESKRGLGEHTTADEFNVANAPDARGFGHDAINRWILIEQRLKRLGLPQWCPDCEGHGEHFTAPARLALTLWVLHPRKGASRGVEVATVKREELPKVYAFLREAADRNAERFSRVPVPS